MRSRYDLATDSSTRSDEGTYYKDIFTIPVQKFQYSRTYLENDLTIIDVQRPDLLMYNKYRISELDDLVLWLNNIGLVYDEEVGGQIKLPMLDNLENFYYKYRV